MTQVDYFAAFTEIVGPQSQQDVANSCPPTAVCFDNSEFWGNTITGEWTARIKSNGETIVVFDCAFERLREIKARGITGWPAISEEIARPIIADGIAIEAEAAEKEAAEEAEREEEEARARAEAEFNLEDEANPSPQTDDVTPEISNGPDPNIPDEPKQAPLNLASITELRLQLRKAGFDPIPVEGKIPHIKSWHTKFNVSVAEIRLWEKSYHLAHNTGVLAKFTSGLDIDIMHEAAAKAVEDLAREHFQEHGDIYVRFGLPPKRLIPLRTDEPFPKLSRVFSEPKGPDGKEPKIEVLCDGQQYVVAGIHPDTGRPYRWFGGDLTTIKRENLPYVRREDMERFLNAAVKLLVEEFGFVLAGTSKAIGSAEQLNLTQKNGKPPPVIPFEVAPEFADIPDADLGEGLPELTPLPFEPIKAGCEWLRTAYETGGKEYSQLQWMLTTLCCVFLENGHELAHQLGNQHPGYTRESTDELWARKNREHKEKNIGWPSCKAIANSGCMSCAQCPHFSNGKSPINLALTTGEISSFSEIPGEEPHESFGGFDLLPIEQPQIGEISTKLSMPPLIVELGMKLWGPATLMNGKEYRFGADQSKVIDQRRGAWFDFTINKGGYIKDLMKQVEAIATQAPTPLVYVDIAKWIGAPVPLRDWAVLNRVPARNVTVLSGTGGIGKTILAMQLAAAVVLNREWFGVIPDQGPVTFVSGEEDEQEMHRRFADIIQHLDVSYQDLINGGLHLIDKAGRNAMLACPNPSGMLVTTPLLNQLSADAQRLKPKLVILDNRNMVYGGNINDPTQVSSFINTMRGFAIDANTAVILILHPSLAGMAANIDSSHQGLAGVMNWHDMPRGRLYFNRIKTTDDKEIDKDLRQLVCKKNNYGPDDETITLRWQTGTNGSGVFIMKPKPNSLEAMAENQKVEELFLSSLQRLIDQNRGPFSHKKKSNNYAPAVLADLPEIKNANIKKLALAQAMDRLIDAQKIIIKDYGPASKGLTKIVIVPKTLAPILTAWKAAIGLNVPRPLHHVIEMAHPRINPTLNAAFLAVAAMDDGKTISNSLLTQWLQNYNEVPTNGLMLSSNGNDKWMLVPQNISHDMPHI